MEVTKLLEVLARELRRATELGLDTGTATGGTSNTLSDDSKDWGVDQWKGAYVEITAGTGKGQIRKIASNTATTLTVETAWTTPPDSTSKYRIFGAPITVSTIQSILSGVGPVQAAQFGTWGVQVSGAVQVSGTVVAKTSGEVSEPPYPLYAVASGFLLSGVSVSLDTRGYKLLELYGSADAATQWRLDISPDNSLWVTDYAVYTSSTSLKDTLWNGFRYIRFRADAAGLSGQTALLILSAKT